MSSPRSTRFTLLTVGAVAFGVALVMALVAGGGPASAHKPDAWADCSGVHVTGVNYDPHKDNRWSVTVNGSTQTGTFGGSLSQTFPVPQDGAVSTWAAMVEAEDGSYHGDFGGSVGPCGETPTEPTEPTEPPTTPTEPPTTPTEPPTSEPPTEPPTTPPTVIPPTTAPPPVYEHRVRYTCHWIYHVRLKNNEVVNRWREPVDGDCDAGGTPNPTEEGM